MAELNANIKKTINLFGIKLVSNLVAQLRATNSIASGRLLNSLNYKLQEVLTNLNFVIKVSGQDYFEFVDQGRKPGKQPPPSKLEQWVKQKGLASNKTEVKSLAFLIGRKIGKFGIKPKNTLQNTLSKVSTQALRNQLKEATAKDIEAQIKELINQTTK